MKKLATLALASFGALALAGCGSSDDASTDAMADDVEVPADEAMAAAGDATPTDDPSADSDAAQATAQEAGDAAAAAAADVAEAAGDDGSEAPAQ
jgi:hypothetical protein